MCPQPLVDKLHMLWALAVEPRVLPAAPQLRAKDVEIGLLRASPSRLALLRSWDVDIQQVGVSFKVNGSAGVTYQGACVSRASGDGVTDQAGRWNSELSLTLAMGTRQAVQMLNLCACDRQTCESCI